MTRRRRRAAVASLIAVGLGAWAVLGAGAAQPLPVPAPLVKVTTKSGDVQRTTLVPISGVPVPIDVDNGEILGMLAPDINVAVGLVAVEELPGKPVVPNITIRRESLAMVRRAPAPPLEIDVELTILDAANGLKTLANVHYGYSTPPGGRIPNLVYAKLVGPLQTGFIDPLEAIIAAPGYGGALDFHIDGTTPGTTFDFDLAFDPLPQRIHLVQDPSDDGAGEKGLDLLYEHESADPDVHLQATAKLTRNGDPVEFGADIERLPSRFELHKRTSAAFTEARYDFTPLAAGKPDAKVTFLDETAQGALVTDATVRTAGLVPKLEARLDYVPDEDGGRDLDRFEATALDGEIDAVELEATNVTGTALPVPKLGPDQLLAATTRLGPDGETRYRVGGRVERVRHVRYERIGDDNKGIDVAARAGDGVKPLRAIADLDDRGVNAEPGAKRIKLDAFLRPLPTEAHATYRPTNESNRTQVDYTLSQTADAQVDVEVFKGFGFLCGHASSTCAHVEIDDIPTTLRAEVPHAGDTDYELSHSGGGPDVRAAIDTTPADIAKRTYAEVDIADVPREIRARVDIEDDVVRAAEFHACDYDYAAGDCLDDTGVLGRVDFLARSHPTRPAGLPASPLGPEPHVALMARDDDFEVVGSVPQVRHVVFHQRDTIALDGETDGIYGVKVDTGDGATRFDARVDTVEGEKTTELDVTVDPLPAFFQTCYHKARDGKAPPFPPPADPLLERCENDHPLEPAEGEEPGRPLVADYEATPGTKPVVTADLRTTAPDPSEGGKPVTTIVHSKVLSLPDRIVAAVLPAQKAVGLKKARRLQALYDATQSVIDKDEQIPQIDFRLERRVGNSLCGDPRSHAEALCVDTTLHDIPREVTTVFDPDKDDTVLELRTEPGDPGDPALSIKPLSISSVSPEPADGPRPAIVIDGEIEGMPRALSAKVSRRELEEGDSDDKSLAFVEVDACFEQGEDCDGIGRVALTATNQLAGDSLIKPKPVAPAPKQHVELVQSGELFRAGGDVRNVRYVTLSKLDAHGDPSPTTSGRAVFGSGDPDEDLRAFVHREVEDGAVKQVVDAVVRQAPQDFRFCMRPPLEEGEEPGGDQEPWCARQGAQKTAIQAAATTPAQVKPDIDVRDLQMIRGPRTLAGTAKIEDLAQRIDVLMQSTAAGPHVSVEGHDLDDSDTAPPKQVAGRVQFDLSNSFSAPVAGDEFPAAAVDPGTLDPSKDPRNEDGEHHNFVSLVRNAAHMRAHGSVPGLKRIAFAPAACDHQDLRYPALEGFDADKRPTYTCIQALGTGGHPLGVQLRTRDAAGRILALDDAHISHLPAGEKGLQVTIATSPQDAKLLPVCGSPDVPENDPEDCRPPLLSAIADRGPDQQGQQQPVLEARFATGMLTDLIDLRDRRPRDIVSRDVPFEQSPALWADHHYGARVKIGLNSGDAAIKTAMRLLVPRFLDLDQPTVYKCNRLEGVPSSCDGNVSKEDGHDGTKALDVELRVAGSDTGHYGTDLGSLGGTPDSPARLALYARDLAARSVDLALLGAPEVAEGQHPTWDAEKTSPSTGSDRRGFELPGYFDARLYKRDEFKGEAERTFIQVDGRFSRPLSIALNDSTTDGYAREHAGLDGVWVPRISLVVRRAPGLDPDDAAMVDPTFRLRVELHKDQPPPLTQDPECEGLGFDASNLGLPAACLILPQKPNLRWLDLQVDAAPDGPESPARLIDAVVERRRKHNAAHVRAFTHSRYSKEGDGLMDPAGKAPLLTDVGMRLEPFNLGLKTGTGVGLAGTSRELSFREGDMILRAESDAGDILADQRSAAARVRSRGGPSLVTSDYVAVSTFERRFTALVGQVAIPIRLEDAKGPVRVRFTDCLAKQDEADLKWDELSVLPDGNVKVSMFPGGVEGGLFQTFAIPIIGNLAPAMTCGAAVPESEKVNAKHPAPAFEEPNRPIVDTPWAEEIPVEPEPPAAQPIDVLNVTGDHTLCGTVNARKIVLATDAVLRVGAKGAAIPEQVIDGHTFGGPDTVCTGELLLDADEIVVSEGAVVTASAIAGPGPGTPGSGHGGGAGHVAGGGKSGSGGTGGPAYEPPAPDPDDEEAPEAGALMVAGSAGRGGADGASGGRGGGVLRLNAGRSIAVHGAVRASGGGGADTEGCDGGAAGGGGSGGSLHLAAPRVTVTGTLRAVGGEGGHGGHGGGGGAGGRIHVDSVIEDISGTRTAAKGAGGDAGKDCNPGTAGGDGIGDGGTAFKRAAAVTRTGATPPQFVSADKIELEVTAVQDGGGPLTVLACPRYLQAGDGHSLHSAALHPPLGVAGKDLVSEDCVHTWFPHSDGKGNYSGTVDVPLAAEGFYGWYAIAAKPPDDEERDCRQPGDDCTYQAQGSAGSTALVGKDSVAPQIAGAIDYITPPLEGCPVTRCVGDVQAEFDFSVAQEVSGVAGAVCRADGIVVEEQCGPGSVSVPLTVGKKQLTVTLTDVAGNKATHDLGTWLVDRIHPERPAIDVVGGTQSHGWYTSPPKVVVTTQDAAPSVGFDDGAIEVAIDGKGVACGTAGESQTSCTLDGDLVPANGIHTFQASAADRLGNVSKLSDADADADGDQPVVLKLDSTGPEPKLLLGPRREGEDGWLVEHPTYAFAAADNPGGSGVHLGEGEAAIRFSLDGNPMEKWNPADPDAQVTDGIHTLCWDATDVAGNSGTDECRENIKVDATEPAVTIAVDPPDGGEGWYRTSPVVTVSGSDAEPGSGLDRVERRLDDGPWTQGEQIAIPAGRHVLRVRAFDKAGNVSPVLEERFAVDLADPAVALRSFPPAPNAHSWFRTPGAHAVTADDPPGASGLASASHGIDEPPAAVFDGVFAVPEGVHDLAARSVDRAGRVSDDAGRVVRVDTTAPVPRASIELPAPLLVPGQTTKLRFDVTDALSPLVKVRVHIFNLASWRARTITVPGPHEGGYRDAGPGEVVWDGRNDQGAGVIPGTYFYRVQALDQAGNAALSSEGGPIVVALPSNPLGLGNLL